MRRIHRNHNLSQPQRPLGHLVSRHDRAQVRRRLEIVLGVGDGSQRGDAGVGRAVVERDWGDVGPFWVGGVIVFSGHFVHVVAFLVYWPGPVVMMVVLILIVAL